MNIPVVTTETLKTSRPDFLIIGAAKCGTTSLAYNLNQHPDIFVWNGEIHYFSKYLDRGPDWYLSHFSETARVKGEKSPTYLYHPECHSHMAAFLPDVKLIIMMRDPVARAFSNWNMKANTPRLIRMGLAFNYRNPGDLRLKSLDFEALVDYYLEHEGKKDVDSLLIQQPLDVIHRGLYFPQIQHLLKYYKREQMLFLISETFFADEAAGYKNVCRFLGVDAIVPPSFVKQRSGEYRSEIPASAAQKLRRFYRPYNEELFRFLGFRITQWEDHTG